MPIDFDELVRPEHTAVITCEMQRGIIGDHASMADLANEVAESGMVERCVELLGAARAAGIRVVHATIEFRADRAGTAINNPLMGAMTKDPSHILQGTPAAQVLPELGPEPVDLCSVRTHGLSPFTGTDLDPLLRNLGVRTIVPIGVSVNEALFGLCIEAANLGYRIALPLDGIAGFPREYALDVIRHSLALMSNRTTVADLVKSWAR